MPEVLIAAPPTSGEIPPCALQVLSASTKRKGPQSVAVQLASESLTWLANAIDWQSNSGSAISAYKKRRERKRVAAAMGCTSGNNSFDSSEANCGSGISRDEEPCAAEYEAASASSHGGLVPEALAEQPVAAEGDAAQQDCVIEEVVVKPVAEPAQQEMRQGSAVNFGLPVFGNPRRPAMDTSVPQSRPTKTPALPEAAVEDQ